MNELVNKPMFITVNSKSIVWLFLSDYLFFLNDMMCGYEVINLS